ncbi:hypothetical protein HK097_002531 [Rhizophlyctis rosea]|uniref:Uncharacterized protein n=1 Tax=Rhizophlyctis rosea TaxID=64517 RepID=A0AAD5SIR5_9FUNG|nr:hypothetical protein HK097_002531 [Rhizophlyctis rosea]
MCMEARQSYKREFVPEELQDENHEKPIRRAIENFLKYDKLLKVYNEAKMALVTSAASDIAESDSPSSQKTKPQRQSRRKDKFTKVSSQAPAVPPSKHTSDADLEEFERQTAAEIEALYDTLFSRLVTIIEEEIHGDDVAKHVVADFVIQLYGEHLGGSWKETLGRASRATAKAGDHDLIREVQRTVHNIRTVFVKRSDVEGNSDGNDLTQLPDVGPDEMAITLRKAATTLRNDGSEPARPPLPGRAIRAGLTENMEQLLNAHEFRQISWRNLRPEDIRGGLNGCESEKEFREVVGLMMLCATVSATIGTHSMTDVNSALILFEEVHFLSLSGPLSLLTQLWIADWGNGKIRDLPAFKLVAWRKATNGVNHIRLRPHQRWGSQELVMKLAKWVCEGDVPWLDAVLRPSRFMKSLFSVDLTCGSLKVLKDVEC